jgi:hypothetical protein
MRYLAEALRSGGDAGRTAAIVLLRALVTWLHDCPAAVRALLEGASHLPLLVELATGRTGGGEPNVAGQCAARGMGRGWSRRP